MLLHRFNTSIALLFLYAFLLEGCSTLYSTDVQIDGFVQVGDGVDKKPKRAKENWFYEETGALGDSTTVIFKRADFSSDINTYVEVEKKYNVDQKKLSPGYQVLYREGVAFGLLVVPFKYRFQVQDAPNNLSPSSAVGGFLGYRGFLSRSSSISLFGFFSPINPVPLNDVNSKDTKTDFGIGYGLGAVFEFGFISRQLRDFQAGIVFGQDKITGPDGSNWPYNSKWWASIGIGYQFIK